MREEHRLLFGPASEDAHGVKRSSQIGGAAKRSQESKRPVHLLNGLPPS
jgi:hypothetical protein